MRFRKTPVLFLLAMGLAIALPSWARQNAAPIPRAGTAFCSGGVATAEAPVGARHEPVALTFRLAPVDPAYGIGRC
jgi:hypothetical protein